MLNLAYGQQLSTGKFYVFRKKIKTVDFGGSVYRWIVE